MKHWLEDTLFKRLFLLMWVALLISHLLGFVSLQQLMPPPDGPPPDGGPPQGLLWLDLSVRALVIGVAAWLGARWLAAPMRRLADAARSLGQSLGTRAAAPVLDEQLGTLEVRQTAEVFNTMSRQLHEQFGAQALLMAAISHDLRTPLARLRLRLEQMEGTERCIGDVHEMDQLIASVLELLQLGHAPATQEQVDVGALLQSLADDLVEQGQAVTLGAAPAAVVRGQSAALRRVIGNLVSNALRHAGSAELALQLQADQVCVTVDDRGPGIPADRLEAVFQPFYRIDSSRSRQSRGSGLGLYIARDLARRQGGEVCLARREGGGLRAQLRLPLSPTCRP